MQHNLGSMYYNGDGVKQDYSKAGEWYEKAAKQEDAIAQYNLGRMYQNGQGVEQSDSNAIRWYAKAAAQGDEDAQVAINAILAEKRSRESSK